MRIDKLRDITFMTAFGLLATHELDAVRNLEWRILPPLRYLPDDIGMAIFILAHVPLFGLLASACWRQNLQDREKVRAVFAGFCCVHVGLHWLFRDDPNYMFEGWISNGLIWSAGLMGGLFLFLNWQKSRIK